MYYCRSKALPEKYLSYGILFLFKRVKISLLQRNAILTFFLSFSVSNSDENSSCNTVPNFPRHSFTTKPQFAFSLPLDYSPGTNSPSVPYCPRSQKPKAGSCHLLVCKGKPLRIFDPLFSVV